MSGRLIALAFGIFVLIAAALVSTQVSPATAGKLLFEGSLGSPERISQTLVLVTPLLIAGIAVFVALQAGLFNIGAEGQLLLGAMCGVVVAQKVPGFLGWVLGAIVGMAAGAAWAYPAVWIKVWRGGHEVISTIMLNNIALLLCGALVRGPLKGTQSESATTDPLPAGSMVPNVLQSGDLRINLALVIGLALLIGVARFLLRSVGGFELRATGANPTAAAFAGIETKRVMVRAMLVSGALAGLAGAFQALAYEGRFYPDFSPGYGFDALGVALLAGASPYGLLPAAMIFGILSSGSALLTIEGVPKGIVGILLGLLIAFFAAVRYREVRSGG